VRIDPTSNAIAETIQVGVLPSALAVDEDGGLWLTATLQDAVVHVDPHPAGAVARTTVHLPAHISAGRGAIWVTAWQPGTKGQAVRLDPRTGVVLATIPVGRDPTALAVDDADVWVANEMDDTVSRIDARTNEVAATIPVVRDPVGVAIGTDAVWVVSRGSALLAPPTLSRIDPSRNMVVETIPLDGAAPIGTAAGAGSLWVASRNLDEVVRIGPLPLPATASASAASDPPLHLVALGLGAMVVLVAGLVRQRPAQPAGGRRRMPDGHLLSALLARTGPVPHGSLGNHSQACPPRAATAPDGAAGRDPLRRG
jgi:YVTN family beta-propeller protein